MTDLSVARPLGERDLRDQRGPNPVRVVSEPSGGTGIERGVWLFDRFEAFTQFARDRNGKPGAHFSCKDKAFFIEVADEQGANALSRSLWIGESTDDEFLAQNAFRLDPSAVTPWPIFRVSQF